MLWEEEVGMEGGGREIGREREVRREGEAG